MKTLTGREINVTPNYSALTFTIRTAAGKYRTTKMTKPEFNDCLHNTVNDWADFLGSSDYSRV
jgi:hypothetical protein